jgi:5-(carboxyamino)imidazole ribonucleotide synthase
LVKTVDVLTFEVELVNLEAFGKTRRRRIKSISFAKKTLKLIQNKRIQKIFYIQHAIPTANYKRFDNLKSLIVDILDSKTKLPFVWNAGTGYDG